MKRIVILGRGGAGRSTLGQQLGGILGTLVTELDSIFWKPGPRPTPEPEWAQIQNRLVTPDGWIIGTQRVRWTMRLAANLPVSQLVQRYMRDIYF